GEETTGIDVSQGLQGFVDPSTIVFTETGGAVNPRKRAREGARVTAVPTANGPTTAQNTDISNLLFLQSNSLSPTYISLAQFPSKSTTPLVSTGLQLAFGAQQKQQQRTMNHVRPSSPALFEELAPHLTQCQDEIDGYLSEQVLLVAPFPFGLPSSVPVSRIN
ncbi:hypothetical protein BHM03_00046852, partial [Ensete ventricosum]